MPGLQIEFVAAVAPCQDAAGTTPVSVHVQAVFATDHATVMLAASDAALSSMSHQFVARNRVNCKISELSC